MKKFTGDHHRNRDLSLTAATKNLIQIPVPIIPYLLLMWNATWPDHDADNYYIGGRRLFGSTTRGFKRVAAAGWCRRFQDSVLSLAVRR